ncbi:MAG: hypothetical protein QOE32_6010, partial [Pseudonocardiales bacterium]|nr:hypothetical protein [Pseudonocardiales bacterium]
VAPVVIVIIMTVLRSIGLFVLAAIAEIGGRPDGGGQHELGERGSIARSTGVAASSVRASSA